VGLQSVSLRPFTSIINLDLPAGVKALFFPGVFGASLFTAPFPTVFAPAAAVSHPLTRFS